LRVVKRLNNEFIVEEQTIAALAVLGESDLGTAETVKG